MRLFRDHKMVPNSHWGLGGNMFSCSHSSEEKWSLFYSIQYKPFSLASLSQFRTKLDQFCYQRNAIFSFWTIRQQERLDFHVWFVLIETHSWHWGQFQKPQCCWGIKYKVHWYWLQPWGGKQSTLGGSRYKKTRTAGRCHFSTCELQVCLNFTKLSFI